MSKEQIISWNIAKGRWGIFPNNHSLSLALVKLDFSRSSGFLSSQISASKLNIFEVCATAQARDITSPSWQYWNWRRVIAVHWGEKIFTGKHRLQAGQWVLRSRVWSGLDSAMMAAIDSVSPGRVDRCVSVTSWWTCSSNYQQSRYVDQSLIDLSSFYLEKAELKGREKRWKNFMGWGDFVKSFLNGLTKERRNKMGKRLMRGEWGQRGRGRKWMVLHQVKSLFVLTCDCFQKWRKEKMETRENERQSSVCNTNSQKFIIVFKEILSKSPNLLDPRYCQPTTHQDPSQPPRKYSQFFPCAQIIAWDIWLWVCCETL